ncbi:MAG TPA: flagellar export chaperone FliS [Chloroflexota bacterium]|nr:flagellar export chaperone FliS [Chloroflexota bacterium]
MTPPTKASAVAALHQKAYGRYQRAQVETADPGQLVVLLYEGLVRFTGRGRLALEAGDHESARRNLLRAQDIVAELMGSINVEAGDIAQNLLRLYEYFYQRLVTANVKRDAAAAQEVEDLVRSLIPAWEEAARAQAGGANVGRAPGGRETNVSLRG